jgi:hypothetical protein
MDRNINQSVAEAIVTRRNSFCAIVVQSAQKELRQSGGDADYFARFLGHFRGFPISSCAIVVTNAHD